TISGLVLPPNPSILIHPQSDNGLSAVTSGPDPSNPSNWPPFVKTGGNLYLEFVKFGRPASPGLTKDVLEALDGIKYALSREPQDAYAVGPFLYGWVTVYFLSGQAITKKQALQVIQTLYIFTRKYAGQEVFHGNISLGVNRQTATVIDEFYLHFY
ncbi:MAG: hypothetical protein Q9226_008284, partial [Calogaya cf. arnoldii]